jgi:hypothetical protein
MTFLSSTRLSIRQYIVQMNKGTQYSFLRFQVLELLVHRRLTHLYGWQVTTASADEPTSKVKT